MTNEALAGQSKLIAYTPTEYEGFYPPFLNIEIKGETARILVRGPVQGDMCGPLAEITVPLAELAALRTPEAKPEADVERMKPMTNEALKPCPWCGAMPAVLGDREGWIVTCEDDDCPINPISDTTATEAEAIAVWNRRTPEAKPEAAERSFTLPRTEHEAFIMRSAIDALFPLPKQEAAPDVVGRVERAIELRRYLFGGEPLNDNEQAIVEDLRSAVLAALIGDGEGVG